MTEYWLVSAPGDPAPEQTWIKLQDRTTRQSDLSDNYRIHLPDLKVKIDSTLRSCTCKFTLDSCSVGRVTWLHVVTLRMWRSSRCSLEALCTIPGKLVWS